MTIVTPDHFKNTAATLECMGGTKHMLKVDGEKMFNHDWHHSPRELGNGWYSVTKGCGWTTAYVKITPDVARHAYSWESIYLGGLNLFTNKFIMSRNKSAQIK